MARHTFTFCPGAWLEIGGKKCFFRSKWERNYARYLNYLKTHHWIENWEYEPREFWFLKILRGVRSYKPDFRIIRLDGKHHWVEVKGRMDSKSKTKLRRFRKYYPEEDLRVCDSKWFRKAEHAISYIEGWEPLFSKKKSTVKESPDPTNMGIDESPIKKAPKRVSKKE